jgi:uncharacterized membrane protein
MSNTHCRICGQEKESGALLQLSDLRPVLTETIIKRHPECKPSDTICLADLNRLRADYIEDVLEAERGELSSLEEEVARSLREQELLSENLNEEYDQTLSFGQRVADKVATFGGSWAFMGIFAGTLICWITLNAVLSSRAFDPYPFILLNLMLSCLAAVQAPVIMMSQNRQEARDRLRAENDFKTNLKAELEIRQLHEKLDHHLQHQWPRLLQIQQMQMEGLNAERGEHSPEVTP